jgi:lipopolysaccharide/colanic/teichoic acid biosynthesis glycosyltransferase
VVAGSMSLVGPRPLLAADPCAAARRSFPAVLDARPGMTGLAQVSGRNAMSARRKSRYDAFYANRASIGMDLQILARTAPAVLSGQRTL